MAERPGEQPSNLVRQAVAGVRSVPELARLLRELRRREARHEGATPLTYRDLAGKTGWSRGIIGEYFVGRILPPTDRFDVLVRLLGATPAEQGALATARDRVEESRRRAAPAAAPVERPAPPRQLPTDVTGFTGRAEQLGELDGLLGTGEPATAVPIVVVSGTAGVGKTALAVHWAHLVARRFPDGQLYVNLRGVDLGGVPMNPAEAIRGFLDALGVPPQRIPAGLTAQAALFRSLLADRRVLVVLDNAHGAEQVRPLLPGDPACAVVVTSRDRLTGLIATEGGRPITVDLMSATEARQLLAERLGASRVAAEPTAVHEIVDRCARLPLALAVVAARATAQPRFPLAALAAELGRTPADLDAFTAGDPVTDARTVFSWSYRALGSAAGRLFRLLGLHPGPDVTAAAAASLAGLPPGRVRAPLTELARAHLVTEATPGRYTFHDLLRAYAAELADDEESGPERDAARGRLLDHYTHTAHAAALLLDPRRDPIPLDPARPGVAPERLGDAAAALDWFTAEHAVLLAALDRAAAGRSDAHTGALAWALSDYFDRRGHWHDWAATQETALLATGRLGDRAGQAGAHRALARAYAGLDRLDAADHHLRRALELFAGLGDHAGQAQIHLGLGWLVARTGRHDLALRHAEQAIDLYTKADNPAGEANALNAAGWSRAQLGDHRRAVADCRRALTLLAELGDRDGEAHTWDSLGYAHGQLGHHRDAAACHQRALDIFRALGDRYNEADTLTHLGDCHRAADQTTDAQHAWRYALRILHELDHPDADPVRERLRRLADR